MSESDSLHPCCVTTPQAERVGWGGVKAAGFSTMCFLCHCEGPGVSVGPSPATYISLEVGDIDLYKSKTKIKNRQNSKSNTNKMMCEAEIFLMLCMGQISPQEQRFVWVTKTNISCEHIFILRFSHTSASPYSSAHSVRKSICLF